MTTNDKIKSPFGNIKRREFLAGTVALAGAATLSTPSLAQPKPTKITGVGPKAGWNKTFDRLALDYEKETGIKVEFEWIPQDAAATRIRTQAGSKDGGIDIGLINEGEVMPFSNLMADYESMFEEFGIPDGYDIEDIFPVALETFVVENKRVALPYRFNTMLMHYQPDVLAQAGVTSVPTTFEEYRNAGMAVTEKFGPDRYGIGMHARESDALVNGWYPFMLSAGGNFYDIDKWETLINKPEAVAALQYYGDLVSKDKIVVPDSLTWEWDGLIVGGQTDRFAMTVTIGAYGTLFNNPEVSQTGGRWAWAKVPGHTEANQSRSPTGGWGLVIPEVSPNKRWAYDFVIRATSKMNQKASAMDSNSPIRKSVHEDKDVVSALGWTSAFSTQVSEGGVPLPNPRDPIFNTAAQQLRQHVSRVMHGQATAEDALNSAASEWERTFKRAGLR